MKKQIITDERVLIQRQKIQSDAFQLIVVGLLASLLFQQYVLKAPFSQYAVEFVMFFAISLFVLIRNLMVGYNIFGSAKYGQKIVITYSFVCGSTVAVISAVRNKNLLSLGVPNAILVMLVTFSFAALAAFAILEFFYIANQKKQADIEVHLNDDENE